MSHRETGHPLLSTGVSLLLILALLPWPGAALPVQAGGPPAALQVLARPLNSADDLAPLLQAAAGARLVLLGEASHGTHEFYHWRMLVSQRLVGEQGISFIAIEGDWASLVPLDRYVRHRPGAAASAREALLQVRRWPRWVWANEELAALGEWLHGYNRDRSPARRVGIHGIDLYAIWESVDAVLAFYRAQLPFALPRVEQAYRPLLRWRGDYRGYAAEVRGRDGSGAGPARVVRDLAARHRAAPGREALFDALQHAHVAAAGERYLASRDRAAWNTRAAHFAQTVGRLLDHYGPGSRGIVWAHNTHVGDARATAMARTGEVNLGQLARERLGHGGVFVIGMGTGEGSVIAARAWEGDGELMPTPPPRADSLEAALLAAGGGDRLLLLDPRLAATRRLAAPLPHRAIGVVFDPAREPWKNYVPSVLPQRYDAFIFLPRTRALSPLEAASSDRGAR